MLLREAFGHTRKEEASAVAKRRCRLVAAEAATADHGNESHYEATRNPLGLTVTMQFTQ
jgi:hypothetical protein